MRTRRLIRPTPRPTKATMTNIRMRGLEVIAPTKEATHLTASVTREETLERIVAIVTVGSCKNTPFEKDKKYGGKTARPHYHLILFNINIHDLKPCGRSKSGAMQWDSEVIRKIWGKGLIGIGRCTYNSCAYTARYMLKKQKGEKAKDFYAENGLEPEFTRCSRKPGIAANYFQRNKDKIYKYDEVVLPGNKVVKPPKYYDKLYDIEYPEEMETIKSARKAAAEEAQKIELAKTTLLREELLELKERTAKEKVKKLPRELEA